MVDHGPGIPRSHRERVFQPFEHLAGTGAAGVGLGLAIAHGLLTAMGSSIDVEDTPGGATTFLTSFPIAEEPR